MKQIKNKINLYKNNFLLINFFIVPIFLSFFVFESSRINAKEESSKLPNKDYLYKNTPSQYLLGPGDFLKISISKSIPELDNFYQVDAEGKINIVKLNRIFVEGLTLEELTNLLNKEYLKFIKYPEIEVQITQYRPVYVYVDGQVESPGLYKLAGSSGFDIDSTFKETANLTNNSLSISDQFSFPTLFQAIREAGGINRFSDLSNIEVIRKNSLSNGGGFKKAKINFLKVINEGDMTQNIRLFDGDTIKIKESQETNLAQISKAIRSNLNPKLITVFVSGRVENPGTITITKSSTLNMALDLAGGTKVIKGKIILHRFKNDGKIKKSVINFKQNAKRGSNSNPYLKNGDIIFVNKGAIYSSTEVISDITRPFTGILSGILLYEAFGDAIN